MPDMRLLGHLEAQMKPSRADLRAARADRHKKARQCVDLALSIIESGHQRLITVEVTIDYSFLRIAIPRGVSWSGEDLHQLQEFIYEAGGQMHFHNDEYHGPHIVIWPHQEESEDE